MITDEQQNEIQIARESFSKTLRPCSAALEELMFTILPVLDHGFIRVVDYMGDETSIVQAARVAYGLGTKKISEDVGLLRYLMKHRHDTPYEMCEIKYHVKLPIFVARQWIRHRTANVNEYSARYSILDKEFYIPDAENLATQSKNNKQGRGDILTDEQASTVLRLLRSDAELTYSHYEEMVNPEGLNLARELARMNLTLNTYTQWYWKCDLRNLLHFLGLRADSHAQFEIRAYADAMLETVKEWVPNVYEAFLDYQKEAITFSQMEMIMLHSANRSGLSINQWLDKERAIYSSVDEFIKVYHLTKREYNEFLEKIG